MQVVASRLIGHAANEFVRHGLVCNEIPIYGTAGSPPSSCESSESSMRTIKTVSADKAAREAVDDPFRLHA